MTKRKDSSGNAPRYFCTFCDASFESKAEWKIHELDSHDKPERYACSDCPLVFSRVVLLTSHRQDKHGLGTPPDLRGVVHNSAMRQAWGCGFCGEFVQSRMDYIDHVGRHYDEGDDMSQWQHTYVIQGLLSQPRIRDAWILLVQKAEAGQQAKLSFTWDAEGTGRSKALLDDDGPSCLQDLLEFFPNSGRDSNEVATTAYNMAQVSRDEPATDMTEALSSHQFDATRTSTPRPTPGPRPESAQIMSENRTTSPIPVLPSEVAEPTLSDLQQSTPRLSFPHRSSSPSFSSLAAGGHPRPGGSVSKVLVRVKESEQKPQASSHGSADPGQGGGALADGPWRSAKSNSLRRVDSDRHLSISSSETGWGANDKPEIARPRTSLAIRSHETPLITRKEAAEREFNLRPLSSALSHSTLASTNAREDWLVVAKPSESSSARSHSGSSITSTATADGFHGLDDSASELMSDDSLSEPDCWLGFDGRSVAPKSWTRTFQQNIDREMKRIWVQYNRDWDAMIKSCAGGSNGNSPASGESAGRIRKTSYSRQATGRGLRPPARLPIEDDEDDDDEMDRHRPNSSLSKYSSATPKRFACPYRKHNPRVYNLSDHEVCAVKAWPTISRLKEHLYRRHHKVHCPRCKETFNDARGLAAHEMQLEGCEVLDVQPPGDITAFQEKQLKSRKHTARRQSDEEKWVEIYRLLFPHVDTVPSPYPEFTEDLGPISSESKNNLGLQHFLLTQLPQLFRRTAEEHAGRFIQSHETLSMDSIPNIIEESLQRAFKAWEDTGNDVPRRAGSSMSFSETSITSPEVRREMPLVPNAYIPRQPIYEAMPAEATANYNWIPQDMNGLFDNQQVPQNEDSGFVEESFLPTTSAGNYALFDFPMGGTMGGTMGGPMGGTMGSHDWV
ncbi:hypothetical protein B0T24DRAFT_620209 [Lasiosphaeria ovina]|uniref:C2H2-type domain-containing protein n=1 Tax=Lasiosphaeria ovina TaxID=92902 RepID=A0AAE0NAN6_9PEZI|nr:hypothetical protein B0T24DRAFT_620209 [Lasiosphaeria ovina]